MFKTTPEFISLLTVGLSQQTGVKISAGKGWSYDVKNDVLTYDKEDFKNLPFYLCKGYLLHEIGHAKYTSDKYTPLGTKYPTMQEPYNALEDCRIEKKLVDQYGDYASEALNYCQSLALTGLLAPDMNQRPKLFQFCIMLMLREAYDYTNDMLSPPYTADSKLENLIYRELDNYHPTRSDTIFLPEVRERYFKNETELKRIISDTRYASNTAELKQIIDTRLFPIIKDWLEQDKQDGKAMQRVRQMVQEVLKEAKKKASQEVGTGYGGKGTPAITDNEAKALMAEYIRPLANRLNAILKEKRQIRYYGGHKSGKLQNVNAYKVALGEQRIFSKRNTPNVPDYNVSIVFDNSPSMKSDGKNKSSFLAGALIDGVAKKLNFKRNYYTFNDDFNEIKSIDNYHELTGGTNDIKMLEQIDKRIDPTKQNLIIILTDGSSSDDPKPLIKKIENKNGILLGIGFKGSEELASRYPHSLILDEVTDIPKALVTKLKSLITR